MVIESFDANLYVNVLDQIYVMQEVPERSSHSAEFDAPAKQKKPPKNMSLLWITHGSVLLI